jgi:hypothetical protein
MATITERFLLGTTATLIGAELNALASSATLIAGAQGALVYNNNQVGAGGGFTLGMIELFVNGFAAAPAAGSAAYVYLLSLLDDSSMEDGGTSVIPARPPDVVIPFRAATGNQRITIREIAGPPGSFRAVLTHNAGTAFAATGNTLRWRPYTRQGT